MTLAEIAAALVVLAAECRDLRASVDQQVMEARRRYVGRFQRLVFVVNCDFSADGCRPVSAFEYTNREDHHERF